MNHFWSLSTAGFAATAISYGPARMGFGLFVPEFRSDFSLSSSAVGFVSSLGFLGFFAGLLIAQALLSRRGPGLPVLVGLTAATAGMTLVALAQTLPVLASGVFLAMSSAGFSWTPFNDAVHRYVTASSRPAALSAIATGTSVGIAAAGGTALATVFTGFSWRVCWALFAVAAAGAMVANLRVFHGGRIGRSGATTRGWADLFHVLAVPLYFVGLSYGTNSAIYLSFASDHMKAAGGVPGVPVDATPALLFICYGLFGLTALATGHVKAAVGLTGLLRLLMAAGALSAALLVVAAGSWAGLILSAGLQGMHVMMTSAVLAFWSDRVFPDLPSRSFTAVLLATAAGNVLGPAAAGRLLDAYGSDITFLAVAALSAAAALLLSGDHVRDRPLRQAGFA